MPLRMSWNNIWQRKVLHALIVIFVIHQIYLFATWSDFFRRHSLDDIVSDDKLEVPYTNNHNDEEEYDISLVPYENYFKYFLPSNAGRFKNTFDETELFYPDDCEEENCAIVKPAFIILGAQKCGTTSLWRYLLQHPQVLPLSQKARVVGMKEVRFFDEQGGSNVTHPLSRYMNFFSRTGELEGLGRDKSLRYISGEGTPNYIRHPASPERIKNILPDVKMILLFREPVDRAYSQYNHALRVDKDKRYTGGRPYEDFVDAEMRILQRCKRYQDYWPDFSKCYQRETAVEVEVLNLPIVHQKRLTWMFQTVLRGIYSRQLMNYARFFAPEQIMVVQSEEFYAETEKVMRRIEDFLDLKPCNWSAVFDHKEVYNFGKGNEIFVSEASQQYSPLDPALRKKMQRIFAPFNRELVRMFSDRGFKGWDYDNDY